MLRVMNKALPITQEFIFQKDSEIVVILPLSSLPKRISIRTKNVLLNSKSVGNTVIVHVKILHMCTRNHLTHLLKQYYGSTNAILRTMII